MPFTLGTRSLAELRGVHPDLARCVRFAIHVTAQDFSVHDGLRTANEQAELFARGASTLDGVNKISRHQTGHAVDLVPYVNGRLRWEWDLIFPIADAMKDAGDAIGVPLRWGGTWGRITGRTEPARALYERNENNSRFRDGPHFELPKEAYP